ncbi:PBECR4 domain-containing protein [Pediococcus parvulus]|uniref:PBECR4 domain-containing protein n=1 Tax=Pediococcus parvulus TaxID=54062 RepID=UPI000709CECC|nr:PBECR4 domain-containing protein [Pediococcus parvulus]MCT3027334.1 hypothetical protein [Pediococcus parvulus]GEL89316.1 hypothetical protein PPA04_05470 [Pediococcus parvulus]GHC07428.1 hypothetical protein GCM10008912_08740 [Pediococcus parvulus]
MRDMSEIALHHLLVSNTNKLNFKEILEDYRECFAGHEAVIQTNYNLLSSVKVLFNEHDVPHLMGWEKVRTKHKNASAIINDIDQGTFTAEVARKSHEYFRIKKRMQNYNFMHRIFIDCDINVFVYTRDMKPNRLKLDIVFCYLKEPKEVVVLGLRKAEGRDVFVPTTLHTESARNNIYLCRKRTQINSLDWEF